MKKIIITLTLLAIAGIQNNLYSGTESIPRVAAHRGANEFAPENTLAAFRKAVELGVDLIEIDVRKTKDNVNIIMHDATLKRTTGLDGNVSDWNYADLKDVSAGKQFRQFANDFASEKISTLEETCKVVAEANKEFKKNVSFYVDCKDPELPGMIRVLKEYSFLETSVFYGNDTRLLAIRELAPEAKLMPAYGSANTLQERIERLKPYAFDISWQSLNRELVADLHSKGIKAYSDAPISATIDDLVSVIEMGIDLIQTDRILNVQEAINKATTK